LMKSWRLTATSFRRHLPEGLQWQHHEAKKQNIPGTR
jgi:hypothetical protein